MAKAGKARVPLRVLIAEDSENDALLLLGELRRGGYEPEYERVETPEAMRAALDATGWDVIVSDYRMPRFGFSEALAIFRESGAVAPFIVVSGMVGEDVAVETIRAGAYDYVMKDNLTRLCATVARGLEEAAERRRAERELRRQNAILEAVRFGAECLLGEAIGWEESIRAVLRRLGEAAEASRVYVFENYTDEEGEVRGTRRYEWVAPGISARMDNAPMQALSFKAAGYGRWVETLRRGEPVYGNTRDFPESERPELQRRDILSMAIVPIFVGGYWWGYVGFDDCFYEREWSAAEVNALGAAASTLGTAIRRKRIEEKLRASEERYRAVVEQATDGIFLLDVETRDVIESNPAVRRMLGYTSEELQGTKIYDLVADPRESVDSKIRRTLKERSLLAGERKYRRKDGTLLDVEVGASVISLGGRELICTIVRDVTERKKSEEALRRSEEEYRAVFELAGIGTAQADPSTGRILRVNPRFCEITGYSAEELLGMTFEELTHPEDYAEDLERFRRVLSGEVRFYQMEKRYVHKDGHSVWVLLNASLVRDADGRPLYGIGQVQDITGSKRVEETLRRREAILESVRFAAERFLGAVSWEDEIQDVLERLGTAAGVSRVYVFENYRGEDGEMWADCRYEWVAAGLPSRIGDPAMRAIPYRAFPSLFDPLRRGEPVHCLTRELLQSERSELRAQDVLAMAVVPIVVEGEWWGVIEFDECFEERAWSAAEVDGLKAAASTLAAALRDRQAREALRQSERLYRTVIEQATESIFLVDVETRRIVESNPAFRQALGYADDETRRLTLYDVIASDRKSVDASVRRVLVQGHPFVGERQYRRKNGSLLSVEVSASKILRDGRETLCVVAHDVTERARVRRLLEERVAALSRIAANLTLGLPMEAVLDGLARSAVDASTADACAIVLIDAEDGAPRLVGTYGLPEGYVAGLHASYRAGAGSLSVETIRRGQPVLVPNVRDFFLNDPLYAPVHDSVREAPWETVLSVPLVFQRRALGAINMCYLPGHEPGEDERIFIGAVADQTAVAVENARLFAQARDKAALEERQRLARELHDSVSQALYGIALGTRAARAALEHDPEGADDSLDYVLSSAEAGLAEMRALIFELRPESLQREGLCAALEKQAAAVRVRHRIGVKVTLCEEPEASLEVKEAIYRIVQEALHNTVKHARAKTVELRMQCGASGIALEVSDDGAGFDTSQSFPGHLGLRSMHERAAKIGGTLEVRSAPGKGTRVRAQFGAKTAAAR